MREQLDHIRLRQHLLDPDDAVTLRPKPLDALAGRPLDLGLVRCAGAEDELRAVVDLQRRVEEVDDALLARDPADEEDDGHVGGDAVPLESVGPRVEAVFVRVDPVVDHLDPGRVDVRVRAADVLSHRARHGDDRVGRFDRRALAERRDCIAAGSELLGLPRAHRLEAVRRDDVRHLMQELGHVATEVRVPGVRVHDVGAVELGRHREVDRHRLQRRAGATEGVPRGEGERTGARRAEAADLEVDQLRELARQVLDVHPGAAVHVRRVFAREEHGLHGRTPYPPVRDLYSVAGVDDDPARGFCRRGPGPLRAAARLP